jgi:hypothetical protein
MTKRAPSESRNAAVGEVEDMVVHATTEGEERLE